MAWIESGDPTAVGDLGFGDTLSSRSIFPFASSLESCVCGAVHQWRRASVCGGFTMTAVYFKTCTSGTVRFICTPDGKIDFAVLGRKFGLDPSSIELNGSLCSQEGLKSSNSWEQMKAIFESEGEPLGGSKLDPVMVAGVAAVSTGKHPADVAELRRAREGFQLFVRSAAQNYQKWESEKESEKGSGKVGKKFLAVDRDPFGTFRGGFLIFIRESYEGLMRIFMEAGKGKRHIVLGTAGIGKSLFSVFWICYLATLKKKVVWKFGSDNYYLLDFSPQVLTAWGPIKDPTHPDLQSALCDSSSWLIIDGKQSGPLEYECCMLLACSRKKENHHEFSKHNMSDTYYLPVWEKAEIIEFYEEFDNLRSKFPDMHVPDKQTGLKNFKELGGVPRYVLDGRKTQEGKRKFCEAVGQVNTQNCLEFLSGFFVNDVSDRLIHTFVNKEKDQTDYQLCNYGFASSSALDGIIKQFDKVGHLEVVAFLEKHIDSQMHGSTWGHLYERVAHTILSRGGKFKRKMVFEDTADGATEVFNQVKLEYLTFKKVEELSKLKDENPSGAYCRASSLNFESVDAVIVPDTLVQYFRYRKGNHGFKIQGLKELDETLKMDNYDVWSCVPEESFEKTNFQNWLNSDGSKCDLRRKKTKALVQKMRQYVVEVDFRTYHQDK